MNQFSEMSHSRLLDLLAQHTTEYTQMLADNVKSNDFYKCKRVIEQLTTELELRHHQGQAGNTAGTTSPDHQNNQDEISQ